jgi:lysophospholipase L1-like esterase
VNDAQSVWLYPNERGASGLTSVPFGAADWDAVYARRTRDFLDRICQRGARRALVLLPVDVNRPGMQRRLERIRDLQARAAAETSCAVAVATAGDAGQFAEDGIPKRLPDGYHMSTRGARIVWQRIEPQVVRLLEANAQR